MNNSYQLYHTIQNLFFLGVSKVHARRAQVMWPSFALLNKTGVDWIAMQGLDTLIECVQVWKYYLYLCKCGASLNLLYCVSDHKKAWNLNDKETVQSFRI